MDVSPEDEVGLLRSVALQNAGSILEARRRAEEELLRTREELRVNQERLNAALSAADTGTFRWNIQANLVDWDGNLDRLLALDATRSGRSLDAFVSAVHPDDRAGVTAAMECCAAEAGAFDIEFRVNWPDGSVHWVNDKGKALVDEAGQTLYVTGACADVTSRRAAEEALRDSEERLRAMFNQAAVGIALSGLDGRFLEMNQKFAEILGHTADELRGLTVAAITHPDDRDETARLIGELLAGELTYYNIEKRYLRKDQSEVWSLSTVTLLKDASGRPQRFLGVIEDITAIKRTEEALRESEQRYRQLASALEDETRVLELLNQTGRTLASTLDLESLLQAVTDAATELSGARFGAFFYNAVNESGIAPMLCTLSGAPRSAFDRFGEPRTTPLFGPTFRGEPPIRSDDIFLDPRYGQIGPHHGTPAGHPPLRSYLAVPVRSRSGGIIGGLFFGHPDTAVFTDRTERIIVGVAAQAGIAIDNARLYEASQRAAAERMTLLESDRAARSAAERLSEVKDEFLATLSHELRTPLNAILGWSQVLRSGPKDPRDLLKGIETIERNARVQTQLIEDLLDMSRITSGKLRLETRVIKPAEFIDAAIETVQPAAEAKMITVERLVDDSAGPIAGDTGRLQQVVWNLLSNAIKFTPKGGRVQVSVERGDAHVLLTVADTGIGIKPEFIPYLFERFRQADASTTRAYGGLGLGLSIVKSLVELHGGTVAVDSPGEGRGTTVTVELPAAAGVAVDRQMLAAQERSADAPAELDGVTVLVVDDQLDARDLMQRILADAGAEVITAAAADDALTLVETRKPDVVVSDIGMPDVDGFELLRLIRALGEARGGRVPAIAVTAFARSEDRTRALRAGFAVHVAKPVDPAELVATVVSVTGRAGQ